jgi:hypothetical protein
MSSIERQAEHGGARMRGEDRPALDEQDRDVVARQLDRGGEAGGTAPDHQYEDVFDDVVVGAKHGRHRGSAGPPPPEQRLLIRALVPAAGRLSAVTLARAAGPIRLRPCSGRS